MLYYIYASDRRKSRTADVAYVESRYVARIECNAKQPNPWLKRLLKLKLNPPVRPHPMVRDGNIISVYRQMADRQM